MYMYVQVYERERVGRGENERRKIWKGREGRKEGEREQAS